VRDTALIRPAQQQNQLTPITMLIVAAMAEDAKKSTLGSWACPIDRFSASHVQSFDAVLFRCWHIAHGFFRWGGREAGLPISTSSGQKG
jgi:hypothetical protein